VHERYGRDEVLVIGLHTVFEHHDAMGPNAHAAFIHEYRLRFPIGIDAPSPDGPVPRTMARWNLRGTPSTLLIDRAGRLRLKHFGAIDELELGVMIGRMLSERTAVARTVPARGTVKEADAGDKSAECADGACPAPGMRA
jgi:hypothetical protein